MPPERIISPDQHDKVIDWVRERDGEPLSGTVRYSDVFGAWKVGGEPIVLEEKPTTVTTIVEGAYPDSGVTPGRVTTYKIMLTCSDEHARQLEEVGIVNFSEESEQAK